MDVRVSDKVGWNEIRRVGDPWTLRLLNVDASGTARVPVRMFFAGPTDPAAGDFRRIEIDLSRFELSRSEC